MIRKFRSQSGMTLIEIMVVLTIIGVIATFATVTIMGQREKALVSAAKTQIKNFETALDAYRLENNSYPQTLKALAEKRIMKNVPKDPWGEEYIYQRPGPEGNPYGITSYGADSQEGGEGVDADIHSWEIGVEKDQEKEQ